MKGAVCEEVGDVANCDGSSFMCGVWFEKKSSQRVITAL